MLTIGVAVALFSVLPSAGGLSTTPASFLLLMASALRKSLRRWPPCTRQSGLVVWRKLQQSRPWCKATASFPNSRQGVHSSGAQSWQSGELEQL